MSLKDKVASAKFAFRDVPICLDGSLVYQRETALLDVARTQAAVIAIGAEMRGLEEEPESGADPRLAQKSQARTTLEERLVVAEAEREAARDKVTALEDQMRSAEVIFRFTALPKNEFAELRAQHGSDADKLYSDLARRSGQYVDGENVEAIETDVWDILEPAMTDGQWGLIVNALDQINIVEGRKGLSFLSRGSATNRT